MPKHGKSPNADKSRFHLYQKSAWKAVTIALSICVAIGTTAALVLPAITLSEATCEIPEHTHSQEAGCYSAGTETEIVCDYEILGVHQHTSDCYDGDGNPACGYADVILHEHDSLCFDESGELICTLPVVMEHQHDGNCYTETQTLVQEGHTHTDECYAWTASETLVCGLEETDEHQHDDTCYKVNGEQTCTREEQEAVYESGEPQLTCTEKAIRYHVHTEGCYTYDEALGENVLTCTETVVDRHQHTEACFKDVEETILTCELSEHTHSDGCMADPAGEDPDDSTGIPELQNTADHALQTEPEDISAQATLSPEIDGAQLKVTYLPGGNEDSIAAVQKVNSHLGSALAESYVMEIHPVDAEGAEITADGSTQYTVTLQFPSGVLAGDGQIQLLHIRADDTVESLPVILTRSGKLLTQISFTTDSFSKFVLVRHAISGTLLDSGELLNQDGTSTLYWSLTESDSGAKTLTVSGEGSLPYFKASGDAPWRTYSKARVRIVFAEGITHTGRESFRSFQVSGVVFPSTLKTIGTQSLSYLSGLTRMEIPGTVKELESSAFIYCRGITEFILHDGTEILGDGSLGSQASGGAPLYIPASVTQIGNHLCWTATEYIVAEDNPNYKSIDGVLFTKDGQTLVDYPDRRVAESYTVPEGITVQADALKRESGSTRQFIISENVHLLGSQHFRDNSFVSLIIKDGVYNREDKNGKFLETGWQFVSNSNMAELVLPSDTIREMSTSMLGSCRNLTSLTIPKSVTKIYRNSILNGDQHSLTDIRYNAQKVELIDSNIADGATVTPFNLTIGVDVDYLPAGFAELVNLASNLSFEGPNTFYVEEGAFANAPAPLTGLSGWIHIPDQVGSIYLLDPETGTATFFASSPTTSDPLVIVDAITVEAMSDEAVSGKTFTVTAVDDNALTRSPFLTELQFQNAKQITSIGAYAFANTNIAKIVDLTTGTEVTTVEDADTLFAEGCDLGYGRYDNTKLTGAEGFGPGFAENMDGVPSLHASVGNPDSPGASLANLKIEVHKGSTTQWVPSAEDSAQGGYESLTGDLLEFQINNDYSARENNAEVVYRFYVKRTNANCVLSYSVGTYTLNVEGGSITVDCKATVDPNTLEIDVTGTTGVTAMLPISVQYPSPKSYGGGVQVSAEIVVSTSEGTIVYPAVYDAAFSDTDTGNSSVTSGQYIQASWKTDRLDYGLYHQNINAGKSNEQKTVSIYSDDTGTRFYDALKYTYSLNNSTGRADNLGCDYVTYVDFEQVLELPEGVSWDEDVLQAIRHEDGKFLTVSRGTVYYNDDKIITIAEPASPLFLLNVGVEADENGKVTLSWRIKNSGTGEMGNISYALTIYQHALSVKVSEAPGDGGVEIDSNAPIRSEVTAEIHYTHTDPVTKESTATKTIQGGAAKIELTKEGTQVSYFGEDITYTIHGVNTGGVPYVFEDAGQAYLWDELSVDTYIKPENMERMFQEAEAGGRHLTIRIDKAQITNADTAGWATPVDGVATTESKSISQSVLLNSGNSDYPTTEASLLIHYEGNGFYRVEQIQQTAAGSTGIIPTEEPIRTERGQDLEELLHRFGYGPTVQALYTCVWQLRNTGEDLVFQPGENHEVYIYATVKNTYQLSNQDWPNHYPVGSQKSISNRAAFLSVVNAENKFTDLAKSNSVSNAVRREAVITMGLSYQDENGNIVYCRDAMPSNLTNKQILDYDLYFTHYGNGAYDDMPMVDELTGNQYLLVPVEANTALAGRNLDTVEDRDGKEYYRLSEGTYTNVYVGEDKGQLLIAGTITVTSNEGAAATTKIKWYYEHIDGGEYELDVKFKTILWLDEHDASYTLGNETWMNDRTNDRIYAALWGGGILLTYNKEIVVDQSLTDPGNDEIFESYIGTDPNPYPVSQGETVLYRLTLDSTGKGSGTYHGSLFADALPDTFGKFAWTEQNVKILDVQVAKGRVDGAEALQTKWSIQREYCGIKGDGMYFIRWDDGDAQENDSDDVYLTFQDNSLVYIYVELTFPKNTEENQLWRDYALAANGATLSNAFYLDLYNASVTHVLRTPGEVRLQKGVYALARGSDQQTSDINLTGTSRYYYNNTDKRIRRVIYYIALYNDGGSRLYLNDIQDQLPAGFTFDGLMDPAEMTKTDHASVMSIVCADSTSSFTENTLGIDYKSFRVKAEAGAVGENGKQNVVFKIDSVGSENSLAYDELRQQYYLDNGQAICFAYAVNIAASGTADEALNTAAMAYTDHVSAGVIVCDGGHITAKSLDYIDQNNGDCVVLTRSEVEQKEYNFTLDGTDSQTGDYWLVSDVSLTRGSIRPGIRKNTVSYRAPGNDISMPYNSSVGYQDIVDWQIRLDNGGDSTIVNYTVSDKMDPPYVFTGPVSYNIFDMNGSLTDADNLLFTVEGFTASSDAELSEGILQVTAPDTLSQWITHINVRDAANNVYSVKIGGEAVELTAAISNTHAKAELSFHWDGASLVMDIHFKDVYFAIPEHGYMTVNLSTYNCTNYYATMTFINQASLYPSESQTFALYDIQSGSKPVYDGEKLVAVMNGSNVAVASTSVTNSEKIVVERDNPTNKASSRDEDNSIVITGRSSVFTYTLNVWNQGGDEDASAIANPAMKKLVILDNLPRLGDTNTQNTTERGSQFLVGLMRGEGTITITETNGTEKTLDPQYYTVAYTDKTVFTDADHNGTEQEGWYSEEEWLKAGYRWRDVRAFRIIIEDPSDSDDQAIIPPGAKVSATFNAITSQDFSEEIARGSYAWNNFGYSYVFVGSGVQNKAMSGEVGVRLAARPALVKKLTDQTGKEYIATEDMSFDFLIYQVAYDEEGDEITPVLTPEKIAELITGKSKEEAKTALRTYLMQGNKVPHVMFYDGLTVPAGSSQSEIVALTPPTVTEGGTDYYWRWTDGTDYRIIELPYSGNAYDNFAFANWQDYSGGHGTEPSYLFHYDVTKIVMLTCTNQYKYWDLQVFKEDDETRGAEEHRMLSGAVFGLYTDKEPANFDSAAENSTIQIELDGIDHTWYLLKTAETGENGLAAFNGLSEYEYYIVELRSPSGYQRIKEPIQIHRDNNSLTRTYTVYNYTTVELPESGGIGTFPYMFSGLACMTLACVLIYITKRKQRKEAR